MERTGWGLLLCVGALTAARCDPEEAESKNSPASGGGNNAAGAPDSTGGTRSGSGGDAGNDEPDTGGTSGSTGTGGSSVLPAGAIKKGPNAGTDLAIDRDGNMFVLTGTYSDLVNGITREDLIEKYDARGELELIMPQPESIPTEDRELRILSEMVADASGNVVVAGPIIVKYDPDGNELWGERVGLRTDVSGTTNGMYLGDVDVDAEGNVYVIGDAAQTLEGELNTGNDPQMDSNFAGNFQYVLKYSPDGERLWASRIPGYSTRSSALAVDSDGFSYVTGMNTEPVTESSARQNHPFVAKLDTDGTWLGTRNIHPQDEMDPLDVCCIDVADDGSAIYIGGQSAVDFGDPDFPSFPAESSGPAKKAVFVLMLDAAMELSWGQVLREPADPGTCGDSEQCFFTTNMRAMVADADGDAVHVIGYVNDGEQLSTHGLLLHAQLSREGTVVWQRKYPQLGAMDELRQDVSWGLALDPSGTPVTLLTLLGDFGEPRTLTNLHQFFIRFDRSNGDML